MGMLFNHLTPSDWGTSAEFSDARSRGLWFLD